MKLVFQRKVPGSITQHAVRSHPNFEQVEANNVQEVNLSGFVGAAQGLAEVHFTATTLTIALGDEAETTYTLRGQPKRGLVLTRTHKRKGHGEKTEYLPTTEWKEQTDLTDTPSDAILLRPHRKK